ncbi:MAG: hypothetical protein IT209_04495 [Armatimonadetes bacterium]|nr:hypothetical protein [Armatimonadota bacterium]
MAINDIDFSKLSVDELNEVIRKAREVKSKKSTPSIKINGYVISVRKHVDSALEAIKKLSISEGVAQRKWDEVETQLRRLQLDSYRSEAEKVKITPRTPRGRGRQRAAKG